MSDVPSQLRGVEVDHKNTILRLVWDSDDLTPEKGLSPSSFSKDDLKGLENGISVDQEILINRAVLMVRVEKQRAKAANNDNLDRSAPLLARAITGELCQIVSEGEDGVKIFTVIHTPVPESDEGPANPAHSEIVNIAVGKMNFNKMRSKLVGKFSTPVDLDVILPPTP